MTTICIVDDESTIRDVVRRYLELEGCTVLEAADGQQALSVIQSAPVDLLILDVMLPELDGFAVARQVRRSSAFAREDGDLPIIMLTSRGAEADRLAGFDLGIDDYVVKPFSPRELVARVKAVLRRGNLTSAPADHPIAFPNFSIDPISRDARVGGSIVALTAREFDLLWLFARHPRQVFSREQLLDQVWGYEFDGDDSTVTVHIRRLREKIETNPAQPQFIQTIWGIGYRFDPD